MYDYLIFLREAYERAPMPPKVQSRVQITFWSRGGYFRGGRLFHHFLGGLCNI